jgi:hypothetical protein
MDNQEALKEGFFPRFIDRPRLIGVFEIDEFFLAFTVIALTIASSLVFPKIGSLPIMLTAIFLGGGSGYLYKKFKKHQSNGYTMHLMYKIGLYYPLDSKVITKKNRYLKENRVIPFGFTKEFYN